MLGAVMLLLGEFPLQLKALTWLQAGGLFLALATPIVLLGMWSLAGLEPVRRWTVVAIRVLVIALIVLLIADVHWQRTHRNLEVLVLRDVSDSTQLVGNYPSNLGRSPQAALTGWLRTLAKNDEKRDTDRIGVISFNRGAVIDALPYRELLLDARAIGDEQARGGTNPAAAIQLGLVTFSDDAMRRMVLIWDGNATEGDIDSAVAAARAAKIPIDVVPLNYDVKSEVLLDRVITPTWQRENEPFTLEIILRSTNALKVTGKLSVRHQQQLMDLDPANAGVQTTRVVTLKPGLNVERVLVPPLKDSGVHSFRASFDGENVDTSIRNPGGRSDDALAGQTRTDTLLQNNTGESFTFVRGKGQILFVDNTPEGQGALLMKALAGESINAKRITVAEFPNDPIRLQGFDAVVLANVPRGSFGLNSKQDEMLANYVHDLGGGLVVIGGEDTLGAGGWQGSKLEEVLPVTMDVPAQRQIPKGALVLLVHSCEMPKGNYWGKQCALAAIDTLGARDEIGIVSLGFNGVAQWDFPLQEKGDGVAAKGAAKQMKQGDFIDFNTGFATAFDNSGQGGGLANSSARVKHMIIISDGDPNPPNARLIAAYQNANITVSTILVFPHGGQIPQTMRRLAQQLGGKAYGPINNNFNQLPQIFTKEATIVRRSLIHEDPNGLFVGAKDAGSQLIKGLRNFPPVYGMVLTTQKRSPQVQAPLVAGKSQDPLLTHWQTGLGRSAVFSADAHAKWGAAWVTSPAFGKFWAQVIRGVARPTVSNNFDTRTRIEGDTGTIFVEAVGEDAARLNHLNIIAQVQRPDGEMQSVRLKQTGPGVYEGEFAARAKGSYVVVMNYSGADGQNGFILAGAAKSISPEQRALRSNEAEIFRIAEETGGRVLTPFQAANIFSRQNVVRSGSPMPAWDILLPLLLALFLLDVAARRLAWDIGMFKRAAVNTGSYIGSFFTVRKVESRQTLDALRRVRDEAVEQRNQEKSGGTTTAPPPDPSRKFEGEGVEGDISDVVGGASDKPLPKAAPKKEAPKGMQDDSGGMGGLLAAKKRAQEQIRKKQEGNE